VSSPELQAVCDISKGCLDDVLASAVIQLSDYIIDDDRKFARIYKTSNHVAIGRRILGVGELGQIQRVSKVRSPHVRVC
jgi:hypothetical protein